MKNTSFLHNHSVPSILMRKHTSSLLKITVLALIFLFNSNLTKAQSWTSPNWAAFNITGGSGCNSTDLTVTWNQWTFFCCGGCTNTLQYKASVELEYSVNGSSGWSPVQTIVKNGAPFSQTFTVSNTGYYRAWVFPEARVLTGPCSPTGWQGTGQSSATPNINITISTPAVANFTINGVAASCTPLSLYNCVPMTLNNTSTGSTGNNFKYRIFIYSSTVSCTQGTGVYSNGSNPIQSNPTWTTTTLSSVDLRALPGFQGTWLAQAQNHTGYFLVKLEVMNDCNGASSVKTALINVSGPPTAASLSLVLNKGNGSTYGLDQTPPANNGSGCYGGGINIANSTGVITYYDSQIDKVNCTTGAFISSIGGHHEDTPSGVSSLTAISYSYLTSGYFGAHCLDAGFIGTCYKISVTVGNACGFDTKWSYFSIDGAYREGLSSSMAAQTINAYPNPSDNIFNFDFEIGQQINCYLNIYDQTGKLVGRILNGEPLEAGNYTFSFDANQLSSGMYYYQLIADHVQTGSIVKLKN